MMAEVDPAEAVHARQSALQQRVLLLAPSFGYWRGSYQLPEKKVAVELDGQDIKNEDVTTPRSVLLQATFPLDRDGVPWKKRFQDIEKLQKALIEKYSVLFPIRGVRIVPKSRGREFFDQLIGPVTEDGSPTYHQEKSEGEQSVAYKLAATADEFVADLDDVFRQIKHKLPAIWEAVASRIPQKRHQMRDKFYVDAVPIELAGGSSREVTSEDLENHYEVVQDACRRKVEEAIEEMVSGPREALAAALADLQNLIARDGRVTSRSFAPVRAAIAKIRMFDFVANPVLLSQIAGIERRLNITDAKSLDSVTAASNGFVAALSALRNEVSDAERMAADQLEFGVRELRGLDLG